MSRPGARSPLDRAVCPTWVFFGARDAANAPGHAADRPGERAADRAAERAPVAHTALHGFPPLPVMQRVAWAAGECREEDWAGGCARAGGGGRSRSPDVPGGASVHLGI